MRNILKHLESFRHVVEIRVYFTVVFIEIIREALVEICFSSPRCSDADSAAERLPRGDGEHRGGTQTGSGSKARSHATTRSTAIRCCIDSLLIDVAFGLRS